MKGDEQQNCDDDECHGCVPTLRSLLRDHGDRICLEPVRPSKIRVRRGGADDPLDDPVRTTPFSNTTS